MKDHLDPSLSTMLRRRAAHWQLYAAVTGSAMAMATNGVLPAHRLGREELADGPRISLLEASARPDHTALARTVRLAMARSNAGAPAVTAYASGTPVISAGGVVPLYGTANVIQPGEWVSIYGRNLANQTAVWNGTFPTSLGGTTVMINGKPAYLSMVSPTQINLQAPDDTAVGPVSVLVTTGGGIGGATVTLSRFSPSFMLLDSTHVTAIILRADGSGTFGNGAYDILGPDGNCFGYRTVAAQAGDTVEVFGVGFGPTTPEVPAGEVFSGVAPANNPLTMTLNNVAVKPAFVGLSGAGLYQVNLVVPPGIGAGDVSIQASIGGMATQDGLLFSLKNPGGPGVCVFTGDGDGGDGGYGDGGDGSGDGGEGDGGDGGDGGGGDGDGGDGGDGG